MNQQNLMQQYFEQQQQNSMNGFPGAGFQPNQQIPSSFNGPTPVSNPYTTNSNYRQNGLGGRYSDNNTFEMHNANATAENTQGGQGFSNFMDPRLNNFDPRNRPSFDPNGATSNMEGYGTSGFAPGGKIRMNELATAMFNNPGAMAAAMQRRRIGMYAPGRENEFMSPTNPFGGFSPQALQLMQQQQRYEAFQRQLQQQLAAQQQHQQQPPAPRGASDLNQQRFPEQAPTPVSTPNVPKEGHSESTPNQPTNNLTQQDPFSNDKQASETILNNDIASPIQGDTQKSIIAKAALQSKLSNDGQSKISKGALYEVNESQKNAAMLAAAQVRAAAAATSRGRAAFQVPGINNMPPSYGPRGVTNNVEQMPSPFPSQGMQSPEFGNIMSPNKDTNMLMQSPLSHGRGTPRNMQPPPYSPLPHSSDSNHSGSDSVKGSHPNINKLANQISKPEEANQATPNLVEGKPDLLNDTKPVNQSFQPPKAADANHLPNDRSHLPVTNKISAPPTPMSAVSAMSPAPSLQEDLEGLEGLSPSIPQSPMSPDAQKLLKARASPRQYEQLSKVYEQITDEEKKLFMERYLAFMSVNGTPVTKLPIIGKQPLDLYTLCRAVCERGGMQEVLQKRRFREILTLLNLPTTNGILAYTVREQYMKYLQVYESKHKDDLLKQWKKNHVSVDAKSDVATIALNETFKSVTKQETAPTQPNSTPHTIAPAWNSSYGNTAISSSKTSIPSSTNGTQFNPRMSYPNPMASNQGAPVYGQSNMGNFGPGQEVPPGYPGYGYQNSMYPRGPMPNYGPMRPGLPGDAIPGGWPRGYSPRQGPPELFPEGLQRMPWSQSQRHSMSAFSSPGYPITSGKSRTSISRDQLNQMSAQQLEQLKQEQQLKLQQYQQQQARYHQPDHANKVLNKGSRASHQPPHDVKQTYTPTQSSKREFSFPPDSIEGTKPVTKKRKKLTSKDLGPVEAWRIMMSLKSGLVSECTWAIDTLNILLSDNNTITYFHLSKLPGLLDTLMDHYRRSLSSLFKQFQDREIPLVPSFEKDLTDEKAIFKNIDQKLTSLWVGVCKNSKTSFSSNIAASAIVENAVEQFDGGRKNWASGGGDNTSHIQTNFPTRAVQLKRYPEGLTYITNADLEKQRKLGALKKNREKKSPDENVEVSNETSSTDSKTHEANSICLGVLDDLLKECTESTKKKQDKPDSLVDSVIGNLELNVICDKKYLEDSKEFICYLNRRLHREHRGNVESEQCVVKQKSPFVSAPVNDRSLFKRCVALSNIFRSLSFIQGNDSELATHVGLILIAGYSLLHKHEHTLTDHSQFKLGLDERTVINNAFSNDIDGSHRDALYTIRENMLVMLSNVGGHLNLTNMKKEVYSPLVNGLLHWVSCRSSEALDPMPTAPGTNALSAQRLAIEVLAKMTINLNNVEYVMTEPNESQLEDIGEVLVKYVAKKNPIPAREFAVILLDNLCHSEEFSRMLCKTKCAVSNLMKFLYEAEKNTANYLTNGGCVKPGVNAEDICGTSISLLRRSVNILLSLSKMPSNRRYLTPYMDDILSLSTSQMIDTSVLALLASVLFELGD